MSWHDTLAATRIRCDTPRPGVARVTLARPEVANAQDRVLLYELDAAFSAAVADDTTKVVVLAADGDHFSSGHDLTDAQPLSDFPTITLNGGFTSPGQHGMMSTEQEIYLGLCWRWRNLPKPTIAAVHGKVIAGGLMLVWPCDLVIAADDTTFADPIVAFGVNGNEYFSHTWELGARKAKELLFRGCSFGAAELLAIGAVNRVVPRAELDTATLDIAAEIAEQPAMGLKLAKLAVNQSVDAQGYWSALNAAFTLHHLGHADAQIVHGWPVVPEGAARIRALSKRPPA